MARARIFEDGMAYFGPDYSPEIANKREKPRENWTEEDWNTFRKLIESIEQLTEAGETFDEVQVKPKYRDFETEINHREKKYNGTEYAWSKEIVANQTQFQMTGLKPDTEYEWKIRQRFINEDGTPPSDWGPWSEIRTFRTKKEKG